MQPAGRRRPSPASVDATRDPHTPQKPMPPLLGRVASGRAGDVLRGVALACVLVVLLDQGRTIRAQRAALQDASHACQSAHAFRRDVLRSLDAPLPPLSSPTSDLFLRNLGCVRRAVRVAAVEHDALLHSTALTQLLYCAPAAAARTTTRRRRSATCSLSLWARGSCQRWTRSFPNSTWQNSQLCCSTTQALTCAHGSSCRGPQRPSTCVHCRARAAAAPKPYALMRR